VLFVDGALGLVLFAFWVFCLIDVITADEALCRNLPKTVWVLIVLLLFDVGAVLWLVAGRTWPSGATGQGLPYRGNTGRQPSFPEYERPGRFAATSTEEDEEFLRQCRERAEEQRQRHRAERAKREAQELQEKEQQGDEGSPA
jgi:hypothetical protein